MESDRGKQIATAILSGEPTAWSDFQSDYGPTLVRMAKRLLSSENRFYGSPQDLVQDFLAEKLLPAERAEAFFAAVRNGQIPLLPRLRASLRNFLLDKTKSQRIQFVSQNDIFTPASPISEERNDSDGAQRLLAICRKRTKAIYEAFEDSSSRAKIPFKDVLFLQERIYLANEVAKSYLEPDGTLVKNFNVANFVETLLPWNEREITSPIPYSDLNPLEIWSQLSGALSQPSYYISGELTANLLQAKVGTWNQWVTRARSRVVANLGISRSRELFQHWPASQFSEK